MSDVGRWIPEGVVILREWWRDPELRLALMEERMRQRIDGRERIAVIRPRRAG